MSDLVKAVSLVMAGCVLFCGFMLALCYGVQLLVFLVRFLPWVGFPLIALLTLYGFYLMRQQDRFPTAGDIRGRTTTRIEVEEQLIQIRSRQANAAPKSQSTVADSLRLEDDSDHHLED
jgi:hypothetical protein